MEIRCDHKKFGEIDDGVITIKCQSKFCGASPGIVVLHLFDSSGVLIRTERFRNPIRNQRKEK